MLVCGRFRYCALVSASLACLTSAASVGCGPTEDGITPLTGSAALAVVCSDYASSAIAMIGDDDVVLTDAFVTSGTVAPGLSAALSGDVVLPSVSPSRDTLFVLDRFGTDVISDIALPSGEVRAQTPVGAAFRGNPQDLFVTRGERWVTRFQPNLSAAGGALERGNDLVLLEDGVVRESLSLDADTTTDAGEVLYGRPSRAAVAGDRVVVGLARLSADFMLTGPGAVAVVDIASRESAVLPLADLSGCGSVTAESDERVFVLCVGPAFGERDARAAASAIVELVREGDSFVELRRVTVGTTRPFSNGLIVVDAQTVWVVAAGELDGEADALVSVNLETGASRELHRATDAFTLGQGATRGDKVYVPDAENGLLVFSREGALLERVDVSTRHGLGAREVLAL